MSTRAVYTFTDKYEKYSIYKHYDGYPSGGVKFIEKALAYAWKLPRFEASEFAAAFVAANKKEGDTDWGGGDVYLTEGPEKHGDLEYTYEISCVNDQLHIVINSVYKNKQIFAGTLEEAKQFAKTSSY